jgi:hypothetical protein
MITETLTLPAAAKESPILFSAPMVRALLDGSKKQTRRVVKARKDLNVGCVLAPHEIAGEVNNGDFMNCPYGQPGDRLWVRESFWGCDMPGYGDTPCVVYDNEWRGKEYFAAEVRPFARKFERIPSIHMPRDCSRINLEITGVRVERLQDISQADARAEGAPPSHPSIDVVSRQIGYADFPRSWYAQLWEQINGAGSWEANPWVWAIEFRRVA